MKFSRSLVFATLLALVLPVVAHAADIRIGETIFAPANDSISGNLYVAGGEVTLSSRMEKDAVVAAGKAIVNGPVSGDLMVVGGSIDILENIQGDARLTGGQITIARLVGGDVVVVGGSVRILPGAAIGGDLIVAGGDVTIDGAVNGSMRVYGGKVILNGLMGGLVSIRAGDEIVFGGKAIAGGKVTYSAPQEAEVDPSAKLGNDVTFKKFDITTRSLGPSGIAALFAAAAGVVLVIKILTSLTTAIALVLIFPGFSTEIVENAFQDFWKSLGIGFAALFMIPVAVVLLAITIVGLMGAIILGILFGFLALLAGVYGGIIFGSFIAKLIRKEYVVSWKWTFLGVLALSLTSLVPFVGWIIGFVFFLIALGTIVLGVYRRALGGM